MKPWPWAIALVFFTALFVAFQCEEDGSVDIINNTTSPVTEFFDGQPAIPSLTLTPGGMSSVAAIVDAWPSTITAKDATGKVVFSHRYTWDELKKLNRRVVIGCDSAPTDTGSGAPTAATAPC